MTTSQKGELRSLDTDQKAIALAVSIFMDRIAQLSAADREVVWKLARCMNDCSSKDEVEEVQEALLEVLDQQPVDAVSFDLEKAPETVDSDAQNRFDRWKEFIGGAVKQARSKAGLTQEQLAEKSGLPQSHISRIECSRLSPSSATIEKIAAALGLDPGDIDPAAG